MPDMSQQKIMFVICNDAEARLVNPIWQELKRRAVERIVNISTGAISREKSDQGPDEALTAFGMPFKRLTDYGTMDVTKILKTEQPDVVMIGSDQEFLKRAFVYAANSLRIPTLSLRLGISTNVANVPRIALKRTIYRLIHRPINILRKYLYLMRTIIGLRWNPLRIVQMIFKDAWIAFSADDAVGRFGCRAIAVAGSWEKDVLIERGVEPNKIFVTGSPEFDALSPARSSPDTAELHQNLAIDTDDKVVLLLTSAYVEHGWWSTDMRTEFITGIIDSLAPLLDQSVHLVIKIHPVEDIDEYRRIVDQERKGVILRKDLKPSDVINISDVVIAGYSTTVLEACALRKPVIVLNIFGEPEYLPYVEMGLATGVYHLSELKTVVEKMLYDLSAREEVLSKVDLFLSQNRQSFDGKATPRITDLILELAGSHPAASKSKVGEGSEISKEAF
jgi:UDP-N-acetylglucosamine 2-epimerase